MLSLIIAIEYFPTGQPKQWGCDVPEFDIFAAVRRTKQVPDFIFLEHSLTHLLHV